MPRTRSQGEPLYLRINDIELYLRVLRRIREYRAENNLPPIDLPDFKDFPSLTEMAEPARALRDYAAPSQDEPHSSCATEPILWKSYRRSKPSFIRICSIR
ncbi:hypothetical protein KIW84_034640 [Lathyrus oleraceus]|uniref:Uncharacterized protein n=1 Tax=Pisum sativum TaxID=3888 RepID=A0A9D4XYZ3_PEA|nr:hypothetical protein KIW84_034640 [Pisum sativum]